MLIHEPNVSTKSITSPECDTRLNDCQNLDSIWMQVRLSKRWLSHVLSWRGVVDEISVQCINYYGGDGPFIYTSLCRCRLNLISNRCWSAPSSTIFQNHRALQYWIGHVAPNFVRFI